jgi:Putative zinc-finger
MEFNNNHPTEEVLERYLFASLPDWEVEAVEEHMLVCHSCIDTAEQLLAFVQSLRSTLRDMPKARAAGTGELQER